MSAALTVVVPNYNHGAVIGAQLEAILSQSQPPARLIVIDDASTDDSVERIHRLIAGRPEVQLIRNARNSGVIEAMNRGLELAQTPYISFAAADDRVLPGLYEQSLALLERFPDAAFCSAVTRVSHRSGETFAPLPPAYPRRTAGYVAPGEVRRLLRRTETWVMGTTVVHRREKVMQAGGFRPALRSYCDGFLYLALALRHGACFIPQPLAIWRREDRGYSTSTSRDDRAMAEIGRAAEALMSGEFADAFPASLRARVRRRLRFRAASANARGRAMQALLFLLLRWHDVPVEVRSRLRHGRIAPAP